MTKSTTVLIADDNARVRSTIRNIIAESVSRVLECANGLEAIQLYETRFPDWVLMDVAMPKLDGIHAARRIHDQYPNARIVMVTDYSDQEMRNVAKAAGAEAWVLKENLFELLDILDPREPSPADLAFL